MQQCPPMNPSAGAGASRKRTPPPRCDAPYCRATTPCAVRLPVAKTLRAVWHQPWLRRPAHCALAWSPRAQERVDLVVSCLYLANLFVLSCYVLSESEILYTNTELGLELPPAPNGTKKYENRRRASFPGFHSGPHGQDRGELGCSGRNLGVDSSPRHELECERLPAQHQDWGEATAKHLHQTTEAT